MGLMAQCGVEYKISLDPSYRRGDYPEKWRYYEIRGKDGTLWYYRALVEEYRKAGVNTLVEELDRTVAQIEQLAR